MAGFLIFAVAFVTLLTLVVRLAKLHVRGELPEARALGLTTLFVGILLLVWWFVTRGEPGARIVQPLILPSPMEVLRAFVPLHFEQGLVRSAFSSWLRVTIGFALAAIVALPLGVYMATFSSVGRLLPPACFGRSLRAHHRLHSPQPNLVRHRRDAESRVPIHRLLRRPAAAGHQGHRGRARPRFWMWPPPKALPNGSLCAMSCSPSPQANIWDHMRGVLWCRLGLDHYG